MKNLTWLAIGTVILAAATAVALRLGSAPGVEAARATRAAIDEFVDEQGVTRLPKTWLVSMPFDGRIESIDLIEGAPVKAGEAVARVVPLDLDLALQEAAAAVERLDASIQENDDASVEGTGLAQSLKFVESMESTVKAAEERVRSGKAKLDYAEKTLQRVRRLRESNSATEDALNQAELSQIEAQVDYRQDQLVLSSLRSMQAATALTPTIVRQYISRKILSRAVLEKEKAQADVRRQQALSNHERGTMPSPVDGIVLERFESNERRVPAGSTLLSIGRLEDLEVEVDVLSQDVVQIEQGAAVDLYGPAIGARPARGTVARIHPAGFTKTSSLGVEQQRVKVIVHFQKDELARVRQEKDLGVGYRVRARIFTRQRSQALVVPRSALFRGPQGEWQAFVVRDGRARLVSLEAGLMNDLAAEVLNGIDEGELVVLSPETNLHDGDRVAPIVPGERLE